MMTTKKAKRDQEKKTKEEQLNDSLPKLELADVEKEKIGVVSGYDSIPDDDEHNKTSSLINHIRQ